MRIAAITLHQPWASLMAIGAKCIETRSWQPHHLREGEFLAIHAGKSQEGIAEMLRDTTCRGYTCRKLLSESGYSWFDALPFGQVVCVVRYRRSIATGSWHGNLPETEVFFGDYSVGRYAWFTEFLLRLPKPVDTRGAQGIWNWEPTPGVVELLGARLSGAMPGEESESALPDAWLVAGRPVWEVEGAN